MTVRTALAELIRFGLVGGSATLAYLIIAILLDWLLSIDAVYVSFCAYSLAAVISFFGHRYFTFSRKGRAAGQAIRFVVSTLIGFSVAVLIPVIFHMFAPLVTYVMVAVLVPIMSFLLLKFFVFTGS
jgi:putative flippase GtrA